MADPQSGVPQIQDKRPKILGLLPKRTQERVLAGIALVMVLVMIFSGRKSAPAKPVSGSVSAQTAIDPSAPHIKEYQARIEEQTRQLALEEAELAQTKQVLGVGPAVSASAGGAARMPPVASAYVAAPEKSWIELDREKRAYQGLYASNLALSYRRAENPASSGSDGILKEMPSGASRAKADTVDASKSYRLFEGTVLETVLTNRLDSTFSGPVTCMVTTPVYASDHQTLLIPAGSRVLGEAKKLGSFGEARLAVAFHRMIMPDGYSVNLDQFKGLDQIGQTGLLDQVNHHYLEIFGVSLAIGAIAGLSQANTRYSLDEAAGEAYQQGVTGSLSQSSLHILDRYLNVLPTFTIREGHRIKIYLAQDLLLLAYAEHPATE